MALIISLTVFKVCNAKPIDDHAPDFQEDDDDDDSLISAEGLNEQLDNDQSDGLINLDGGKEELELNRNDLFGDDNSQDTIQVEPSEFALSPDEFQRGTEDEEDDLLVGPLRNLSINERPKLKDID